MTKSQAKKLAQQIFDTFDAQIVQATNGTNIPPRFIAGLVANEAGKDRQGNIVRSATRFEPGVYDQLVALRDGKRRAYQGISSSQLQGASDAALRALATSYDATQIMGWHCINSLHCTIADLRNPEKHFFYTVKLLQLNGFPKNASEDKMDREMREWNSGSEIGHTYSPNYVSDARYIREMYAGIEGGRGDQTVADVADTESSDTADITQIVGEGTDNSSSQDRSDESNSQLSQEMESKVTVTGTDLTTPANVVQPHAYEGVGFWNVIKRDMGAAFGGNLTFQGVSSALQQLTGLPAWLVPLVSKMALIVLISTIAYFMFRIIHYLVFRHTDNKRMTLEAQYKADPTKKDINWVKE